MRKQPMVIAIIILLLMITFSLTGCSGGGGSDSGSEFTVTIDPSEVTLAPEGTKQFKATVTGSINTDVTWKVKETNGGTIDGQGNYQAPLNTGDFHVIATSVADPAKSAKATVHVVSGATGAPYYSGTITLTRTGPGTNYTYNEQETITIKLDLQNGTVGQTSTGWSNNGPINAQGNINNVQPVNPNIYISTNGWVTANNNPYGIPMVLDIQQHTLMLGITGIDYNCTYTPAIPGANICTMLGATITVPLPVDTSQLNSSTTLNPDPLTGARLDISWNLTLH